MIDGPLVSTALVEAHAEAIDPRALPPRRPPLAPGHRLVRGMTSDGYVVTARVSAAEAERLERDAETARAVRAARRAYVGALDDDRVAASEVARLRAEFLALDEASRAPREIPPPYFASLARWRSESPSVALPD